MVKPGTYTAKVVSHPINDTKSGAPQVTITFSFDADGRAQTMTYFGSLKDGALEHTVKALLVCGLKGNNPAGPLEIGREVSIVVDEKKDLEGKLRTKISWVNALGGVRNVIPADLAQAKLSALEGAVMAARQKLNIHEDDEIPF